MTIPAEMAQEMLDEICCLCRRLNPQHADCDWCLGTDAWRKEIAQAQRRLSIRQDVGVIESGANVVGVRIDKLEIG